MGSADSGCYLAYVVMPKRPRLQEPPRVVANIGRPLALRVSVTPW